MEHQAIEFSQSLGTEQNAYLWSHIISNDEHATQALQTLSAPKTVEEGLLAEETRPKCFRIDDGLLIYLRAINFNRSADPDDMVSLRLWVTETQIISATKQGRGLRSINEMNSTIKGGGQFKTVVDWFCAILEKITDKICDEVELLENRIELIEEQLSSKPELINRQDIIEIRKKSSQIKRFIAPQREALDAFQYSCEFKSQIQSFRVKEQTDRVLRYIDELEILRERSGLILDEVRNAILEKQSERMYVLSLVTAIFLPLSFLTGVFGMNVAGLPGIENSHAFAILTAGMGAVAILILIAMKIKRWL